METSTWTLGLLVVALLFNIAAWLFLLRRKVTVELTPLTPHLERIEATGDKLERSTREEHERSRERAERGERAMREELSTLLRSGNEGLVQGLERSNKTQLNQFSAFAEQLDRLIGSNEKKLEGLRETLQKQLRELQQDNNAKLDKMRETVDEKLQGTLEKRLSESFQQVSTRLEQVHKGLGEMQTLASGVGDLKRVLSNVKTRGTWGEILLDNLLEQVLAPEQYASQVVVKPQSRERVDFAVRLPGATGLHDDVVWLPIDAKFPKEDFERLVEASELADQVAVEAAAKALEMRVKSFAKEIHGKYISPPDTTDFALMFLASESLYAEVLRRPGLADFVQREYRVTLAGPTTLAALLNSLQMGFRTLAIQERSSEVWKVLGAVKTEFGRFGDVLTSVHKKLNEASNHIEKASVRTRAIERKLRGVEELPALEARALIGADEETEAPSSKRSVG